MAGKYDGKYDGDTFGADSVGLLSTRNILVAAILTSLGGSGTAFVRSANTADRYTATEQRVWEKAHTEKHDGERQLENSEYAALAARTARNEVAVSTHQDGHPARIEAKIELLEAAVTRLENSLRALERAFDRQIKPENK